MFYEKYRAYLRSLRQTLNTISANVGNVASSDVISRVIRISHQDSAHFIYENCEVAVLCYSREELWDFALKSVTNPEGLFLEFGVADGYSLNVMAPKIPDVTFFGFDSFEGLPEAWHGTNGYLKGAFDRKGTLPDVPQNVRLIKGWFEETVPSFQPLKTNLKISFIHLDADIYSSTKTVLNLVGDKLCSGSIIVFDEYHGYPGWQNGEKKAWEEYLITTNLEFKFIAFSQMQAAIEII